VIGVLSRTYQGLVYLLLYLPIAVLIAFSFNDSRSSLAWRGFTTDWYLKLIEDGDLLVAAGNSAIVALLAATCATVVGTLTALALYRYRFRGKTLAEGLVFVLIMAPEIVMGISLLILFVALGIGLGFTTVLLAHVTFCLPFVTVTVLARLNGFDRHLVEAAQDLGASELQTVARVILPMAAPALAAGWLLSFTLSLDDVIITTFVAGPDYELLPLKLYSMVRRGVTPEINALSTVLFALTLVIAGLAQRLLQRR
jgi:spermidine/putrescine transport system permease protein